MFWGKLLSFRDVQVEPVNYNLFFPAQCGFFLSEVLVFPTNQRIIQHFFASYFVLFSTYLQLYKLSFVFLNMCFPYVFYVDFYQAQRYLIICPSSQMVKSDRTEIQNPEAHLLASKLLGYFLYCLIEPELQIGSLQWLIELKVKDLYCFCQEHRNKISEKNGISAPIQLSLHFHIFSFYFLDKTNLIQALFIQIKIETINLIA